LHYEGIQELLEIVQTEYEWRQEKEKTLEEHFEKNKDLRVKVKFRVAI